MNIHIKPMQSDAEKRGKAYVHWRSWKDAYVGLVDPEYLANLSLEKLTDFAFRYPQNTLIAMDSDNIVGFACYGEGREEDIPDVGELFAIYVLKEYYHHKVGYLLMKESMQLMKNYPSVVLWVIKENQRAISFYLRYGFQFDGFEKILTLGKPVTICRMVFHNGYEK